jgi:hypothetical protein
MFVLTYHCTCVIVSTLECATDCKLCIVCDFKCVAFVIVRQCSYVLCVLQVIYMQGNITEKPQLEHSAVILLCTITLVSMSARTIIQAQRSLLLLLMTASLCDVR